MRQATIRSSLRRGAPRTDSRRTRPLLSRSAVPRSSHGPVELFLGDSDRPAVVGCGGPPARVTARVAECLTGEHDESLGLTSKVAIPTTRWFQRSFERDCETFSVFVSDFELDEGPDLGLLRVDLAQPRPSDLCHRERDPFDRRTDTKRLADECPAQHHGRDDRPRRGETPGSWTAEAGARWRGSMS